MSEENLLALQALCCSVQTLLGPSKSLKCCLSSDSSEEDGLISDPLQLVDHLVGGALDSHPAIRLVHEACQDQKKTCGCGITTLVCISTYWARGVAKLIHQGIRAPVVFEMFEEALSLCEKTALTSAIPLEIFIHKTRTAVVSANETTLPPQPSREKCAQKSFTATKFSSMPNSDQNLSPSRLEKSGSGLGIRTPNKSRILAYSRHFVGDADSKYLSRGKEAQLCTSLNSTPSTGSGCAACIAVLGDKLSSDKTVAMQLASKVTEIHLSSTANRIQLRYVLQHSTLGKEQNCSRVVHGAVVNLHADMVTVATKRHGRQLRVIVLDGDCTPGHTHLGLQKKIHIKTYSPQQIYESNSKVNWLHSCTEVLQKLEVGVIVVGGAVSPSLWEHCIAAGIVVLKGLDKRQLEGVCHITGATPISYLAHCLKRHVGCHTVELVAEEWGWNKPSFIRKGQTDTYFERRYLCTIKSVAPGMVVSVLLCGKTKCLVNILEDHFQNCLHKLKLAIEDGYLLPGGGRTEALCIAKLQQKLSELNTELSNTDLLNNSPSHSKTSTDVSFTMATSWMGDRTLLACWRPLVYEVCIQGLLEYIARVIMNSNCSALGHYGAMVEAGELVKKIERDVVVMKSCSEFEVLDVAKSKVACWRRALELLRFLFLSTRSRTTVQQTIVRHRPI